MSSKTRSLVFAAGAVAMVATPVLAETKTERELREMREIVLKLQDQVDLQQSEIDLQKDVIEEAGLEDGSGSSLSSFLEGTDFEGWVAASYFYDFNDPKPGTGANASRSGTGANAKGIASTPTPYSDPFHASHNSFQFDEAWFIIDRAATEESPAGFHFEITYGNTASVIQGGSAHLNGNDFWIPEAYVEYETPWGPKLTAGKFSTTIGYEVVGAPRNVNITRGVTYNTLQPIDQIGAKVSQEFDNGFSYTLGIVNGYLPDQPDLEHTKSLLWGLGLASDTASISFNGTYSQDEMGGGGPMAPFGVSGTGDTYVLDVVAELTPTDTFLMWMNFDYANVEMDGNKSGAGDTNPEAIGVSLGGRVGVTDQLGIGARAEYVYVENDGAVPVGDGEVWSFTGTTDYALTDNLTWKVELRYELATNGLDNVYARGANGANDDMVWLGTQLFYTF